MTTNNPHSVNNRSTPNQDHVSKELAQKNTWRTFKSIVLLILPKGKFCSLLLCILIIIIGRIINYYAPIFHKDIVNSIDVTSRTYRWDLVVIYVGFKFLQRGATGGIGLLNNARDHLWIHVQQYTSQNTQVKLFRHLHGLSLRWHRHCKTGEILPVMHRGIESINKLLDTVIFSVIPTVLDCFLTVTFFAREFSISLGFVLLITIVSYIVATISITTWRSELRRLENSAKNAREASCMDSLLNFETVKYYAAESIEVKRYEDAIVKCQKEERESMTLSTLLNFIRNIIVTIGLLIGSRLCLHMVVNEGSLNTGDYVLFASSIVQLYVPLNSFGNYYGDIQKYFVDIENMLDLLEEPKDITDVSNASNLIVNNGFIEFSNVSFSYTSERSTLKNINFVVPSGKTVAIVGPSGAGKSSIIHLLSRFYDTNEGSIFIDGQDIKTVTQESLRKSIGVVPQDTILFNDTIKYNIQYGRIDASDEDVKEAAKYADIHDGYEKKVGERGLCLSGGEKQRIAIARTILKAPKILLLDEATSSLDSQTEKNIQNALNHVCANRTTIIIAHRLSTIIHADEILVLKEGEIVERGKHVDLIAKGCLYKDMWETQQRNEREIIEDVKLSINQTSCDIIRSIWLISYGYLLFSVLLRVGGKLANS